MKVVKIIALIFLLIGMGLIAGSMALYSHENTFLAQAKLAQGTVKALVPSHSSNSITYHAGVEFITAEGATIQFTSSSGSNPPAYHLEEKVEVFYIPSQPERAEIKGFFSQWGAVAILGGIGMVFALIGGGIFFFIALSLKKQAWLKLNGTPVEATIKEVFLDTSLAVNGRNPFRIMAQWQDPVTSKLHLFKSDSIWFDPAEYIRGNTVTVLIDSQNPKKYWMDTSFLPELA